MIIKKKHGAHYMIIFFLIIMITVGYAYLNTTISINGSTALAKNTWNVHFENIVITDGSIEQDSTVTIDDTSTLVTFGAKLQLPGDFYEFTIDIVNDGTIDAKVSEITKTALSSTQEQYLDYTVFYSNNSQIMKNDKLPAGEKENIRIRVEYKENADGTTIQESNQALSLMFSITYIQDAAISGKLFNVMASQAVADNISSEYVTSSSGINFNSISSTTNGQGVYLKSDTKNNRYPIYYYRGDVTNNNVIFANHCWKMVRTTETGGVKMVYNGKTNYLVKTKDKLDKNDYTKVSNTASYPYTFDSSALTWNSSNKTDNSSSAISFSVKKEGFYVMNYSISSESCCDRATIYLDGTSIGSYGGELSGTISLGKLTSSNEIKVVYSKDGSVSRGTDSISFSLNYAENTEILICNNTGTATQLEQTVSFNANDGTPKYAGYMYGNESYQLSYKYGYNIDDNSITFFGNDVTYENGTYRLNNLYLLLPNSWSDQGYTISQNYHYTCFNNSTTCSEVYYIYYINGSDIYYILLKNGEKPEDALKKMLTESTNENSSTIKNAIDNWYTTNMTEHTEKLEDTTWCNDRSIYSLGGWDKDTDINNRLQLGYVGRNLTNSKPSLKCTNKNDNFTVDVKNGNGNLTYPIGLLTADEIIYAGANYSSSNNKFYLYTGKTWWTMTPNELERYSQSGITYSSYFGYSYVTGTCGVRPAISLKAGTNYKQGDGTPENPYIVE